jgi:membrane-associated phospholipid phosphatase
MTAATKQELMRRPITALWLTPLIALPYALAGRVEPRPVLWLTPGPLENWIPVETHLAPWIYISFYGLLYLSGLLLTAPRFRRYVLTLVVTSLLSVLAFLLLPSGVPRDSVDPDSASALYRWLVEIDPPRNAFPSEHASLSFVALLALSTGKHPRWLKCAAWIWFLLIYWSTIATRQHVLIDLATGAALGAACWWWAGRRLSVAKRDGARTFPPSRNPR